MSINNVQLLGNLGFDPELQKSKTGKSICLLNIATDTIYRNADNTKVSRTDWHKVVCYGATAENCARYLKQGRKVFVEGRIETGTWKAEDGSIRNSNRIVARTVHFIDAPKGADMKVELPEDEVILS